MSDVITQLFELDVTNAVQSSISRKKPLFVYSSTGDDSMTQKFLVSNGNPIDSVVTLLSSGYVCLKIQMGLPEFQQFKQIYRAAMAPSFTILTGGKAAAQVKESLSVTLFAKLIEKHAARKDTEVTLPATSSHTPTSVEKHKSEYARQKHEQAMERQRLRALIAADRRETRLTPRIKEKARDLNLPAGQALGQTDNYVLSVRLLDGEMVKGEFKCDLTLLDVKRWIEREKNVILISSESGQSGIMTRPGFPEPSRIAFYSPGTNVTYTEPQELCRLRDLDLYPRLALILKAEYEEEILNASAKSSTWRQFGGRLSTMLLALYEFFDYGVDDARRDYQALNSPVEEVSNDEEEEIPHFALLSTDTALPAGHPEEVEVPEEKEKVEEIREMDYSLVGLTRQGTPAPSGTSRVQMGKSESERDDVA